MVKGTIKIGKPTAGHRALLTKMGYAVEEKEGLLHVEGSEFVRSLDVSGEDDAIKSSLIVFARERLLLTYGSKVTFRSPDGEVKTLTSLPAVNTLVSMCRRLGLPNLSCLVVKPAEKETLSPRWDDFFAALAEE